MKENHTPGLFSALAVNRLSECMVAAKKPNINLPAVICDSRSNGPDIKKGTKSVAYNAYVTVL
jgi:hypothetical protein